MKGQVLILSLIGILCLTSQFALSQISEGGTPAGAVLQTVP